MKLYSAVTVERNTCTLVLSNWGTSAGKHCIKSSQVKIILLSQMKLCCCSIKAGDIPELKHPRGEELKAALYHWHCQWPDQAILLVSVHAYWGTLDHQELCSLQLCWQTPICKVWNKTTVFWQCKRIHSHQKAILSVPLNSQNSYPRFLPNMGRNSKDEAPLWWHG